MAFAALCAALAYGRLFFGVDFVDEAWYVAMLHRFGVGDVPYVDEFRPQQNVAVLVAPLFQLLSSQVGEALGPVLLARHLFFLGVVLQAGCAYLLLRSLVGKTWALLIAPLLLLDVFYIPSISYNTMGRVFLSASAFLAAAVALGLNLTAGLGVLCALLLSIAVVSYPPLAVPASILLAAWFVVDRRPAVVRVGVGFLLTTGVLVLAVVGSSLFAVPGALSANAAMGVHTMGFERTAYTGYMLARLLAPSMGLVAAYGLLRRFAPEPTAIPLFVGGCIGFLAWTFARPDQYQWVIAWFAGVAVSAAFLLRKDEACRRVALVCVAPLFTAGVVTALSSANGYPQATVGWGPVAVIALALLLRVWSGHAHRLVAISLLLAASYASLLKTDFGTVYGQGLLGGRFVHMPAWTLPERVTAGPYRGLWTTSERKQLAESLVSVLGKSSWKTLSSCYDFPAAYLYSRARPATPSAWISSASAERIVDSMRQHWRAPRPDAIFVWKHELGTSGPAIRQCVPDKSFRRTASTKDFDLWVRSTGRQRQREVEHAGGTREGGAQRAREEDGQEPDVDEQY